MKRFELLFTFLQLPIDYLALLLAGFTAYAIRFSPAVQELRPVLFANKLSWERYWPIVAVVALGWIIIFAFSGLYSTNPNRKFANDLARVVMACSTSFAAITIYVFFTLQKFDSRFLVLAGWLLATIYVTLGRLLLRGAKGLLYRLGVGRRRTVIIGNEAIAKIIRAALGAEPRFGYQIIGEFNRFNNDTARAIDAIKPDEIIFTNPRADEAEALSAIDFASERHLTFKYSADLFDTVASNVMVSAIAGIPIIEIRQTRLAGWWRIIKRLMDIVGSGVLGLIFLPFTALIALIILIETGRPIIYRNERVGQLNKKFITLKFRTMHQKYCTGPQFGAEGDAALKTEAELIKTKNSKPGPVYKIKGDPRLTPVGRWLRRWSLDELPQLWNVLKGEMSLVGPRPHQPREVAQYQKQHTILFAIKPGLSGLAQISGRSDLTFADEARLDTFYVEHWNLYLDLIILIKTPFVVLKRTGSIV